MTNTEILWKFCNCWNLDLWSIFSCLSSNFKAKFLLTKSVFIWMRGEGKGASWLISSLFPIPPIQQFLRLIFSFLLYWKSESCLLANRSSPLEHLCRWGKPSHATVTLAIDLKSLAEKTSNYTLQMYSQLLKNGLFPFVDTYLPKYE